jgi:hypothetical protein
VSVGLSVPALIGADSLSEFEALLAEARSVAKDEELCEAAHKAELSAAVSDGGGAPRHRRADLPG